MTKFVVVSHYGEIRETSALNTVQDALDVVQEQADDDGDDYNASRMKIFAVGDEIPFVVKSSEITVSLATNSEIPAPLAGETVSDYARRLTGAL